MDARGFGDGNRDRLARRHRLPLAQGQLELRIDGVRTALNVVRRWWHATAVAELVERARTLHDLKLLAIVEHHRHARVLAHGPLVLDAALRVDLSVVDSRVR